MSRSRRKTPIVGITNADSEKRDKQRWHRALRRKTGAHLNHTLLATALDPLDPLSAIADLPPVENKINETSVTDTWGMSKDGRQWCEVDDPVPGRPSSLETRAADLRRILGK